MGGNAGAGQRRIAFRSPEALSVTLEGQHPIAEHPGGLEGVAQALRHRPEILANHQAPGPHALQRELAQKVLQGKGDIGPSVPRSAVGDPELPGQAHHVVDPQGARVAHVTGEEVGQGCVALRSQAMGIVGRQAPDLPLWRDRVGRRAQRDPVRDQLGIAPDLRSVGGGADGQIAADADGQA